MRFRKKHVCWVQLFLVWLGDVSSSEVQAEPLALTADWTYQGSNAQAGRLDENYSADYSKRLDLTELMTMDATLRCSSRSDADSTHQNVTPSLSYQINNDLFFFNLSGTDNEEYSDSLQGDRSYRSLAATWNSAWNRQAAWWLPAANLNATQNWQDDSLSPARQDSDATGAGGSLDWDLASLARVFYNYNTNDSSDLVSGNESTTENHLTRVETEASFLDGRGVVTLSQQFATVSNDYRTRVEGGFALLPIAVAAYHGESVPNPATLAVNAALTDGNRDATAVTVNNPVRPMNIGLRTNTFQPLERIYLYTDTNLSSAVAAQFSWDLYTSSNNFDWTLEQTSIPGIYNPVEKRFEFVIPAYDREFVKLVAVNDPAITAVHFTEVEAFQAVAASGSMLTARDTQDTYQTDASMSFQVRPDLQLTSTVAYLKNNSSTGFDLSSTGIASGLSWNPNPEWSMRFNGNRNLRARTGAVSDENRSYGVSVSFPSVPAVESMVGVSLSESYEDARLTNTGYNYTLQFIADLYRDLSGRLNCSLNQSDGLLSEVDSETLSTTLGLTARLVPGLVADWSATVSDTSGQGSTVTSDAMMSWRLTDRLSLRGNLNGSWGEEEATDVSAGFDAGLTDTMQMSMTQRRQFTPDASNITAVDWRWTITQYLSMMTSGAFLYGGETDEWNVYSRVNTRFTTF